MLGCPDAVNARSALTSLALPRSKCSTSKFVHPCYSASSNPTESYENSTFELETLALAVMRVIVMPRNQVSDAPQLSRAAQLAHFLTAQQLARRHDVPR